jgi:hypothetical protein
LQINQFRAVLAVGFVVLPAADVGETSPMVVISALIEGVFPRRFPESISALTGGGGSSCDFAARAFRPAAARLTEAPHPTNREPDHARHQGHP